MNERVNVGNNIKLYRKNAKLTQVELADKANISRSYLADVENGRYNPSLDVLQAIAKALNAPLHRLLEGAPSNDELNKSLTPKEERDIARDIERILNDLESDEALAFHGEEEWDEESRELLRLSLEQSMRLARKMAKKKFTPKKYRKE